MSTQHTQDAPIKRRAPRAGSAHSSSQVIARVTPEQRATWEAIGGATWLRTMLDAMQKTLDAKR